MDQITIGVVATDWSGGEKLVNLAACAYALRCDRTDAAARETLNSDHQSVDELCRLMSINAHDDSPDVFASALVRYVGRNAAYKTARETGCTGLWLKLMFNCVATVSAARFFGWGLSALQVERTMTRLHQNPNHLSDAERACWIYDCDVLPNGHRATFVGTWNDNTINGPVSPMIDSGADMFKNFGSGKTRWLQQFKRR
jgi:hypothetical protein